MGKHIKVLIIGGGAAGMTAAIIAARGGAEVILLEQLNRVGKKILATGNGRCNLTNSNVDISMYHGNNVKFAFAALKYFDQYKAIDFFEDLGIHCIEEEAGKIFPASGQASSVLDALRYEMSKLNVVEMCDTTVTSIVPKSSGFDLHLKNGSILKGDRVILACGGKANPALGSNGSGYDLANALGHKIIQPFPALVKLKLNAPFLKSISGAKIVGEASIESDGKVIRRDRGEILFTDYGISGPPIIQLSRCAGEQLRNNKKTEVVLDLFPEITFDELLDMLEKRRLLRADKPFDFNFIGLINKRFINVLLNESGISKPQTPCNDISKEQLKAVASKMKRWTMTVSGTQSWNEAQVTAGGIDISDINPKTMESKLVPGLYFAGEIMDIDGDCGGFNLQWAWSSGYISGLYASQG